MSKAEEMRESTTVEFISERSVSLIESDFDSKGIDRVR